jgi:hypothetical protein
MGLRGRPPETGAKGLTFTHDKCHGKPRLGWISGDVHVLECHVGEGKSKPCERVLLGTNAVCPGCKDRRAIEPLGYVPLRDQTGRPTCVVVRKDRIPFIANLDRGLAVTYGKDEGRFESVYVIPRLVEAKWEKYFTKPPTDDMGHWLPTFLGVPHLAAAMRALFRGELECQPVVTDALPPPVAPVVTPAKLDDATLGERGLVEGHKLLNATLHRINAKKAREGASQNGTGAH